MRGNTPLLIGDTLSLKPANYKVKGKVCIRANVVHRAKAWSQICSMQQPAIFLILPGWDASPSQGYPQYPFMHLGGERHCESKVSCPRTQHNVTDQAWTWVIVKKSSPKNLLADCRLTVSRLSADRWPTEDWLVLPKTQTTSQPTVRWQSQRLDLELSSLTMRPMHQCQCVSQHVS